MTDKELGMLFNNGKFVGNVSDIEITFDSNGDCTAKATCDYDLYSMTATINEATSLYKCIDKIMKGVSPTMPTTVQKYLTKPEIEKVIFNEPATVILWKDGTKTVVKAHNEPYDEEKGFVMAYLKRLLGNDNTFNKEIRKWMI